MRMNSLNVVVLRERMSISHSASKDKVTKYENQLATPLRYVPSGDQNSYLFTRQSVISRFGRACNLNLSL